MSGGPAARVGRRRWLIPEVVQTSAMDCGPAVLKALLNGFDLPVDYGQLRTACQTHVDGTSIDTLEELAGQLGLDAEQVMVPRDHVVDHGPAQPSLLVSMGPRGAAHFVALWRTCGPFVQVMDPARGRIWMRRETLAQDLYLHDAMVPADAWRTWAGTPEFLDPLRRRLKALGLSAKDCKDAIDRAVADPTWRGLGVLDAAVRMLASLQKAGALARTELRASLETFSQSLPETGARVIPGHCWSVRPAEDNQLHFRGAVQRSDLLVLDETFGAFDPENVERAMRCVLQRAPSVLAIAHPSLTGQITVRRGHERLVCAARFRLRGQRHFHSRRGDPGYRLNAGSILVRECCLANGTPTS